MLNFLKNLWRAETKPAKRKSKRPASRRVLGMEGLESRDLMAVGVSLVSPQVEIQPVVPAAVSVKVVNNDLYIYGTNGPDKVQVSPPVNGKYVVKITTEVYDRAVTQSSYWGFTGGDVFFYGYGGGDSFAANNVTLRITAYGGDGNDYLLGSYAADNLNGGEGRDEVRGGGANDTLNGNGGDDKIYGFDGNDRIDGGTGYDRIFGEGGDDTLLVGYDSAPNYVEGGAGNDTIEGSLGNDELLGGAGNDTISANDGDDIVQGNDGHDYLFGGYGHDNLNGGAGNDYLYGSLGNDYLYGGDGLDYLYGDDGDDDLDGGGYGEEDYLYGQGGKDRFRRDDPDHWYDFIGDYPLPNPGGNNYIGDLEPGEEVYL